MKLSIVAVVLISLVGCAHSNPQTPFFKGTLYYQKAPEVKALYYQAYNAAKDALKKKVKGAKKLQCVVLDVDETVLDNSPYQGWLYQNKTKYSQDTWDLWVKKKSAAALPGAVDFIKFAQKLGVKPLLITNRKTYLEEATFENLKAVGISIPRKDLVGKNQTSSKVERRKNLTRGCEVALLIGDSLADFDEVFEGEYSQRLEQTHRLNSKWGRTFFIIPNPMYGDWLQGAGKQPLDGTELP